MKINCEPEVVLQVACSMMEGETYPQIEAGLLKAGVCISAEEAEMATCYVILFLKHTLGKLPEDVADFCANAELPLPRDLVLGIARHIPPLEEMNQP